MSINIEFRTLKRMLEIAQLRLGDFAYDKCPPIMGNLSLLLIEFIVYTRDNSYLIGKTA